MKKIATDSAPSFLISPASFFSAAVSSGVTTSPLLSMRSGTSRLIALIMQIEGIGPVAAGDFQNVAKALARYQRGGRAFALDQGVDHQGRAVIDQRRLRRFDPGFLETVENAVDQIIVSRGTLGVENFLRGMIERDQIRERAADIDGDGVGHSDSCLGFSVPRLAFGTRLNSKRQTQDSRREILFAARFAARVEHDAVIVARAFA